MDCKGSFRNWNVIESLDSVQFDELKLRLGSAIISLFTTRIEISLYVPLIVFRPELL